MSEERKWNWLKPAPYDELFNNIALQFPTHYA